MPDEKWGQYPCPDCGEMYDVRGNCGCPRYIPEPTTTPAMPKVKAPQVIVSKRKMRPGGGKAKGNGFEGLIAKKLSAALPLNFIRSPGSGARIGGKNFATIGSMMGAEAIRLFNADVVPVNESEAGCQFNFSVECKAYATPDNFTSLVAGSANIYKWFQESVVDSAKVDREPILIFKWNHTPIFVAVAGDGWDEKRLQLHPALSLLRPALDPDADKGRFLDIFELDELLKHPDFWITPTRA